MLCAHHSARTASVGKGWRKARGDMEHWDYAVENVRAHDLMDALERYGQDGWEIVSVIVQQYVETTNFSPEIGTEQKALIAALYHVFAKKRQPSHDTMGPRRVGISH